MDHLIGQRFNLISKSEIRYVGTLHEINPEQSTIALEDVYSYGTEGRKVNNFIPASQQKFDYIVFRGSDVKDIKVADEQKENKQPEPPNMPNDPAIVNSSRPGPSSQTPTPQQRDQSPFPPPGYPPPQHFGGYYPPPFGRGYGPPPGGFPPGPGFQGMPFGPPPPGYFGPPGQGFPQGPNQFSPPPMPIGPPGQRQPGPPDHRGPPPTGLIHSPKPTSELPVDYTGPTKPIDKNTTPTPPPAPANVSDPPAGSTPSVSSVLAPTPPSTAAASLPAAAVAPTTAPAPTPAVNATPTGPKSNRVTPAVPMTVNQKSFVPNIPATKNGPLASTSGNTAQPPSQKPAPSAAAMAEASRQAKEAVAAAMAKLDPQASAQAKSVPATTSVDALAKKVGDMRTFDATPRRGRLGMRGMQGHQRGGPHSQPQNRKIEIPKSDYDFESANAKFNKDDLIKEAIASGSPIGETPESSAVGTKAAEGAAPATNGSRKDSLSSSISSTQAYNKSSSFFDNISSESKDREEGLSGQPGGRGWRGEEIKRNIETFGQGSVDGGSGGGYRGRGRGGFRGRGRPYGGQRGSNGGRGSYNGGSFRGQSRSTEEVTQT